MTGFRRRTRPAVRWQQRALLSRANAARHAGRYEQARDGYLEAIALAERLGPDEAELGHALNGLGIVGKYTGRFAEAGDALYRRALAVCEQLSYRAPRDRRHPPQPGRPGARGGPVRRR